MKENNIAFIDGQNLFMGTVKRQCNPWNIDLARFRKYLSYKYNVKQAYYHLGYFQIENKFEKILFPSKKIASSLYKILSNKYFAYLDGVDTRAKIGK